MAETWKVSGEVNGGERDGERYVLQKGFKLKREAEVFIYDYERKANRNFKNLSVEKEME